MAEATVAAVTVTAEYEDKQHTIEVSPGTTIGEILNLAAPKLGIPEPYDVEAYPRKHTNRSKLGLAFNSQVFKPIELVFAQYAYASG